MAACSFSKCTSSTGGISVKNLTVTVPGKELLIDVDLKISFKAKYALVAPNGSGKTTLLNIISNRQLPIDDKHAIYQVTQTLANASDTTSCMRYVLDADARRNRWLQREEEVLQAIEGVDQTEKDLEVLLEKLEEVQNHLNQSEDSEARASKVLKGLGFTEEMKRAPTSTLSGGWRMRLSLARALVMLPDILLLDEPTNHLDLRAVVWLEEYLRTWKKTVVVVTHDQDFIDTVATDILTIYQKRLIRAKGNYSDLIATLHQQPKTDFQQERCHFDFGDCPFELPSSAAVNLQDVSFSYGVDRMEHDEVSGSNDMIVIKNADMCIHFATRVAVLGLNGSGKTTLLKLVAGILTPSSGQVKKHIKIRLAYYGQHTVDDLTDNQTAVQYLAETFTNIDLTTLHKTLSLFGLAHADRKRPLSALSGGQRSRLILTRIYLQKPHILVLDEPTNHLDITSIEGLAEAIKN